MNSIPDCDRHNPIEDPIDELDAYGHMNWCVCQNDEADEDGEWMACFDAIYNPSTNTIDYEVVVDGGCFVDTVETGSIPAWEKDKVAGLKKLPDCWHEQGMEHGLAMDEECLRKTRESWSARIDELLTKGVTQEDEAAFLEAHEEQSIDYFNRFIAGDR